MSRSGLGDQFEMKLKEILTSTNVQVNVKTDSGGQVFLYVEVKGRYLQFKIIFIVKSFKSLFIATCKRNQIK